MNSSISAVLWVLGILIAFIPLVLAIYRFLRISEQQTRRHYIISSMVAKSIQPKYSKLHISQNNIIAIPVRKTNFPATYYENGKRKQYVNKKNKTGVYE